MTNEDPGIGLLFDKEGNPLTALEWGELFGNLEYRFIKSTALGKGREVKTIWNGFCGQGDLYCDPPHIFATALLPGANPELWASTEAEALEQHAQLVREHS